MSPSYQKALTIREPNDESSETVCLSPLINFFKFFLLRTLKCHELPAALKMAIFYHSLHLYCLINSKTVAVIFFRKMFCQTTLQNKEKKKYRNPV